MDRFINVQLTCYIGVADDCLDPLTEDEEDTNKPPSRAVTPEPPKPPKPPPDVSDRIQFLLKTLEFNQVDMYR